MILALLASALAAPADLAPGAPELTAAENRLRDLLDATAATRRATSRLQVAWTERPTPKKPCEDADRLALGWRIERFGAAWREATQAARAQADRVSRIRSATTVAPLVDARWSARLDALEQQAHHDADALLEASAWEAAFVRPTLAACPAVATEAAPGIAMTEVPVQGEPAPLVAIVALGDGYVCPGGERADDAVVLVKGMACWSASPTCGCTPEKVEPGAVIGKPKE